MSIKVDAEKIKNDLEQIIESLGFELADISTPIVGGRLVVKVFIFSDNGVTLDDCAVVSRNISEILDKDDPISGRYTLEVSSLGLGRPLITVRDFERRIGEKVRITYKENEKSKVVEGILLDCKDNFIRLDKKGDIITIPVDTNPRGKIIF